MTPLGRYIAETLVTLFAISGLAILVLYGARRSGVGRPSGPIALAGRLVLDARRAIYLVRVGDSYYVVGASEAGLTKLGELTKGALGDAPLSDGPAPPRSFKDFLNRLGTRRSGEEPESPHGQ